ncbi:MAG: hypothetical protein ABUK01_19350 [Leptospirales bacterium]
MHRIYLKFHIITIYFILYFPLAGVTNEFREKTVQEQQVQTTAKNETEAQNSQPKEGVWVEVEWDIYYTNIGLYMNL